MTNGLVHAASSGGWTGPEPATRRAPPAAAGDPANAPPAPRTGGPGRVITVASGKGGVGKSNLAAGLAVRLAESGRRVALIDADLGSGNLDLLVTASAFSTINDVIAGRRSARQAMVALSNGVHFLRGSTALPDPADGKGYRRLLAELASLRGDYDFAIIDCGSGVGREVVDFCRLADEVLVIATPEPPAYTDAYGLIKAVTLAGSSGRLSLLVNQVRHRQEAATVRDRLVSVAAKFLGRTVYDAGFVPSDAAVAAAVRRRTTFVSAYPKSPASRQVSALAVRLGAGCNAHRRWWRRCLGWLGKLLRFRNT